MPNESSYPFLAQGANDKEMKKKSTSKWIKFGVPLLIVAIIVAVVVGAVVGTHKSAKNRNSSSNASGGSSSDAASASSAVSAKLAIGRFAIATDSEFMVPVYPSTVSLKAVFL